MSFVSKLQNAFKRAAMPAALVMSSLFAADVATAQDPQTDNTAAVQSIETLSASNDNNTQTMGEFNVGGVTFAAPWVLLGLGSLPVVWFLLRSMPRKPQVKVLPTIKFLSDLSSEEQKPDGMPWWQKTLRLSVLGAAITGLALPMINESDPLDGDGPLVIVVDNDWASAPNWPILSDEISDLIDKAEKEERQIFLISTAEPENANPLQLNGPFNGEDAREYVKAIKPHSWPADRDKVLSALDSAEDTLENSSIYWMSNGLQDDAVAEFASKIAAAGKSATVMEAVSETQPYVIVPPRISGQELSVTVLRADPDQKEVISLTATDQAGNPIAQAETVFESGKKEAEAFFDIPNEFRNQLSRIAIDGQNSAGSIVLMDESFRHRPVGLLSSGQQNNFQELLDEKHYIETALQNYSNLRKGSLDVLLDRSLSVIIMTDNIALSSDEEDRLEEWVQNGGTILRFAGPRLAANPEEDQDLLPVPIREGVKVLENKVSGTSGATIETFDETSPFFGIEQAGSPIIKRKVVAQPSLETEENTWARLSDGTPFVTGKRIGDGWSVLIHTTADTNWSNLPLSKLFIDMMRAVIANSHGVLDDDPNVTGAMSPVKLIDGFGQVTSNTSGAKALSPQAKQNGTVSAQNPPGLYGQGGIRYAHNLGASISELSELDVDSLPSDLKHKTYSLDGQETDLKDVLLMSAFALAMTDMLLVLGQQGFLRRKNLPGFKKPKMELGG